MEFENEKSTFTKYQKSNDCIKVLLMYLLLNNYDIKTINRITETEEEKAFGTKIKRVYGVTSGYVDISEIEKDLESIQEPTICSVSSFEYHCNDPVIYKYVQYNKDQELRINDMGILSKYMIINKDMVVSSNKAIDETDKEMKKGFMFFMEYVLNDKVEICKKWKVIYKNKVFQIFYMSENEKDKFTPELMYEAIEIDKNATYKLVIYIILKMADKIDEVLPSNFIAEKYEVIEK